MTSQVPALHAGFADPPTDARPLMRWWWFGPDVDRGELTRQLDAMRRAGIGGVEVAVVYPMSKAPDQYLSSAFLNDLRFAAEEAQRLVLRFDLTIGSGWPYGGPHITPDLAARRLHWDRQDIGMAAIELRVPATWPDDEFVAAYLGSGAEAPTWERLPVVDGVIQVPPGLGPRTILTVVSRLTGQHVKRAAAGAEGAVLDHYSSAATSRHIQAVADPLLEAVPAELIGDVFCDSLEVYGANWTPNLLVEFANRRGYDAHPLLWQLQIDAPGAARFRTDYYRTLTELCEENFIAPMREWAAGHGLPFRIQGYGEPPTGVSSYRHADRFEGESWGWKDLPSTRWASSAAQIYGQPIVSSEIWTFTHSPPLRATPLDLKGEAHDYFLCGVNQLVGHGWPYSPSDADGAGWLFYAAGTLDDRNPWWPAAQSLFTYLRRLCWLLRQGERVSDIGIYTPLRDVYAKMAPGGHGALDLWRRTRDHIGFDMVRTVRESGFDFDLFDDDAIERLDPARFPVLVLPYVHDLPDKTLDWLRSVERAGGDVLAIAGNVPVGKRLDSAAELGPALAESPADVVLTPQRPHIGTIHRRLDNADAYIVINAGAQTERFEAHVREHRTTVERWDPMTGDVLARIPGTDSVPLVLEPYEAAVLVAVDADISPVSRDLPNARGSRDSTSEQVLSKWRVRFDDQNSAAPVRLPHRWEDSTDRAHYSGGATYTASIQLDAAPEAAWLDLGSPTALPDERPGEPGMIRHVRGRAYRADVAPPVGEIAVVIVNGVEAGVVWSPPYRLAIEQHLRAGDNTIELRVFNTGANTLAADASIPARDAAIAQRFGVRFRLQDVDHAMTDTRSGLLDTPRLVLAEVVRGSSGSIPSFR